MSTAVTAPIGDPLADVGAATEPLRAPLRSAPASGDVEVLRGAKGSTEPGAGSEKTGNDDPERTEAASGPGLPVLPNIHRVVWRTIVKSWDDGIIGWAAQAAFWQALSLPPLLLGLLGSVGYVAGWFGPDTVDVVYARIIDFAGRTFTPTVVDDLITPTVDSVLGRGRIGLMSVGFVLSLWAGSSAVSCFITSVEL